MKTSFKFMKYRKLVFLIVGILTLISIASLSIRGLNYGIDFSGGIAMEIKSNDINFGIFEMRRDLYDFNPELQEDNRGNILIRIGLAKDATDEAQNELVREIKDIFGDKVVYEQIQIVGPRIGGELIRGGILAIIFAFVMMSIYVWIRYKSGYAIGAFISLSLDFIFMFGFFSIMWLDFSQISIAVILIGVGYSINDKIVNYDRITENSKKYHKMPTDELIDLSVNEMLSRTIMTSISTALGISGLLLFAGQALGVFAIAMLFSVFMGTLTSIFISNAMLMYFKIREQ